MRVDDVPPTPFAEGMDAARWRTFIHDADLADDARRTIARALADAGAPVPGIPFSLYRRFADDGDRAAHERLYFANRTRLFAAAIGALLSDEVPIATVEESLWAACDEYAWALPAHIPELAEPHPAIPHDEVVDLYAAETAFALAEITALLRDRLDPLVVARVHREVERRVLTPFRTRRWFWEDEPMNWAAVCGASVGLAAMHLGIDDGILERCTAAMGVFLSGYGDDGVCTEGLHYWTYGFGHFAIYAEALRQRTGEDHWAAAKVGAILRFPSRVWLGGRAVAAFSDAEPFGAVAPGLAAFAGRRGAPVPRELWSSHGTAHNWGLVVRRFAWAQDASDGTPAPGDAWYPDAEWLITRQQVDGHLLGLAAKGGHNAEPHNHNDLGSFVFAVDGEPLLSELGIGLYDRAYFDEATRYDSLVAGSQGHSVPIIAGVRQRAGARARVVSADDGLELDLTDAYGVAGLRSITRRMRLADGILRLDDRFALDAPAELVERFVSLYPIEQDASGAVIRGDRGAVRLTWSDGWEPRIGTEAYRDHAGDTRIAHLLDLVRTAGEARCEVRCGMLAA